MRHMVMWIGGVCTALCANADVLVEHRYLDGLAIPKRWSPAECETSVSTSKVWEHPAICMHIPVDFNEGEKQYPIGWPRMYLNLQPDEQGWRDYDRFEFQIFTETSRTNLPQHPLVFHLYDAQGQKKLVALDFVAIGAWKTFSINLSDVGLPGDVTRLGFNINESDYCDKDMIDFHCGGFRLTRAAAAQVTELKAVAPALFCDSRVLPVELVVEGPPEKLAAGIPFQLRNGDRVAFAHNVPVTRGRQVVYLPIADIKLAPGTYALIVNPETPALKKEVHVTLTSSPWQCSANR
ncbi:MAG TPA: hypothetical protein PKM57_03005 [Kiritimatiellia bacterium]|nr:hypothetical protein [Kiritimatiellia bacterium]HPS05984.1 hypothetical protein [Kiritimatiellia bacterium]